MCLISVIFLLSFISCININEFELNPAGSDSGTEWIEFYSDDEIDLKDYRIMNNDGGEITLSGSFSGYFIYEFEKQWLDNSDEGIFLYKGDDLIDETGISYDSKNDDRTLQYCDTWIFTESTKGEKNKCENEAKEPKDNLDKEPDDELEKQNEALGKDIKNIDKEKVSPVTGNTPIILTPKSIKTEKDMDRYAIYCFAIFCVLLGSLFWIKKKQQKKHVSEFENE